MIEQPLRSSEDSKEPKPSSPTLLHSPVDNKLLSATTHRSAKRVVEARSAILLANAAPFYKRSEITSWLVRQLFVPLSLAEQRDGLCLLRLAGEDDNSTNASPRVRKVSTTAPDAQPGNNKDDTPIDYMLSPRTRLVQLAAKHTMVFIIDMSSSLATIDTCHNHVPMGTIFESLYNTIESLVQPFDIDTSAGKERVEPDLCITVIVECSQFGSNINVIPILAEYPTMRVLVQNMEISLHSIPALFDVLSEEIDAFQQDLATFRQSLRQRRSKLGYELDVRNDHPTNSEENDGVGDAEHPYNNHPNSSNSQRKKSLTIKTPTQVKTEGEKKDIWGIGKSGSSLSYILHAGVLALELMTHPGRQTITLFTDGAVNSSIQDEALIRKLSGRDITCNVVHLAAESSFLPSANFGFVADNEILHFVTKATGGVCVPASECMTNAATLQKRMLVRDIILRKPRDSAPEIDPFQYKRPRLRHTSSGEQRLDPHRRENAWAAETRSLRYQKYPLLLPIEQVIRARGRQGFRLTSVEFDSKERNQQKDELADHRPTRKERVLITLTMYWEPSITLEYRIRATLAPTWSAAVKARRQHEHHDQLLDSLINPKAELLIRTNHAFSHLLQNWDIFQRRWQMMGVVTGTVSSADMFGSPGFYKIAKLKRLLSRIYDSDRLLQTLYQPGVSHVGAFQEAWHKLEEDRLRQNTACWYDACSFDLILNYPGTALPDSMLVEMVTARLTHWATFTDKQCTFVLVRSTVPPRFCEARVLCESKRLVNVQLLCFRLPHEDQQQILAHLKVLLEDALPPEDGQQPDYFLRVTNRPLFKLLLRDADHYLCTPPVDYEQRGLHTLHASLNWPIGEFIVPNYLCQRAWYWDIIDPYPDFCTNNNMADLQTLAFDILCKAREKQGFVLLTTRGSTARHYYKEIQAEDGLTLASQYYVWKASSASGLRTEFWIEPVTRTDGLSRDARAIERQTFEEDASIIKKLVTYDFIHAIGRQEDLSGYTHTFKDDIAQCADRIAYDHLLDLSSVLSTAPFFYAGFASPVYYEFFSGQPASLKKTLAWLQDDLDQAIVDTRPGTRALSASAMDAQYNANTLCRCPRPDRFFLENKDILSRLPAIHRDLALLHYYFEQCISTLSDALVPLNCMQSTGFYASLQTAFQDAQQRSHTLRIPHELCDTRCYIKSYNLSSFIVILLPSLESIAAHYDAYYAKHDRKLLDHLGVLLFECYRPSNDTFDDTLVTPLDTPDYLVHDLDAALQPRTFTGNIQLDQTAIDLQCQARLLRDITHIYARCFTRSVYTSLLHGRAVDASDLETALNVCEESMLHIDLTGYMNVQTLLKKQGSISLDEIHMAYQRFNMVLSHYFEPIVFTDDRRTTLYCYRPPFAKTGQKLGASLSGEMPTNLAEIAVAAQNPLFLRLEYVLQKPGMPDLVFPLDALPSSYAGVTPDGEAYNYEPTVIGSAESPVGSGDGTTATLRLVCRTLPSYVYDSKDVLLSHHQSCPADSAVHHQSQPLIDPDAENYENFPDLSQDKQEALIETKTRLSWLLTEEIMHGLLRAGPVSEAVVRYVEAQLKKKNPFVDFPTTIFMPLVFVRNQQLGRKFFFEQLETTGGTPYRLVRVRECFYASHEHDHQPQHQHPKQLYDELPPVSADNKAVSLLSGDTPFSDPYPETSSSDDFCQGLGISIMDDPDLEEEPPLEQDEPPAEPAPVVKQQLLYWLLIIPQAHSVQIYFYSKVPQAVNRSEIIRVTKALVNDIIDRSNKKVLLQYLHETRMCSKYLVAPQESDHRHSSSDEMSSDDEELGKEYDTVDTSRTDAKNNLVEILSTSGEETVLNPPKKFQPGQFACPVIYTRRFALHWRLQPNSALHILATDVLGHFSVKNRRHMFVCTRDDSVVYCTLKEQSTAFSAIATVAEPSPAPMEEEHLTTQSARLFEDDSLGTSPLSQERKTFSPRLGTRTQHETRELVLHVHGIDLPSWITEELVGLLENRLLSHITLREVQHFLMRNPTSKVSRADIDFILPVEKEPAFRGSCAISRVVRDVGYFLHLLRKNVLSGPLQPLKGQGLNFALKRHHALRYGVRPTVSPWQTGSTPTSDAESMDVPITELCFYYSCINRAPGVCTPFELDVGQGMAGVMFTLIDCSTGGIANMAQNTDVHPSEPLLDSQYVTSCFDEDTAADYRLAIDIWSVGQLELAQLYEHLKLCVRQTLCDYIVDYTFMTATKQYLLHDMLDWSVSALQLTLQKATEWGSQTVRSHARSMRIYPWCLSDITLHLQSELTDIQWTVRKPRKRSTAELTQVVLIGSIPSNGKLGTNTSLYGDDSTSHSRHESVASSVPSKPLNSRKPPPKVDTNEHTSFILLILDVDHLVAYTYNCSEFDSDVLFDVVFHAANRQEERSQALTNVLHQKMGLFHHTSTLADPRLQDYSTHPTDPSIYIAARNSDGNTVLRDAYAEPVSMHGMHDRLVKHGVPFLNTYQHRSQLQTAHEKAFMVYSKWANRYAESNTNQYHGEMMNVSELQLILKASRLLHFCRTPLIFSEATLFDSEAVSSRSKWHFGEHVRSDEMTSWYQRLTRTFMTEYASYLEAAGMHLIVDGPTNDTQNEAYLSDFRITDDYCVASPVVYLLQVFKGGTIMCEVRLTDVFVFVTLYTLHRRYGRMALSPHVHEKAEERRSSFKGFTEECDRFKQKIHVNSFVFDFHLRQLQRSLDDVDNLPDNLHLLNIIKNTLAIYNRPAGYSRNRLVHGFYEFTVDQQSDLILSTILRDAPQLGFKTLSYTHQPVACFTSSDTMHFDQEDGTGASDYRHSLIVAPAEGQQQQQQADGCAKVVLQYLVIVTYRGMERGSSWLDTLRFRPERSVDSLDEVMDPGTHTLGDIVHHARSRIDTMISKAIYLCHRVADWNRLYQAASQKQAPTFMPEELLALASQFQPLDVSRIDEATASLLRLPLPWDTIFDLLKPFYPHTAADFVHQSTRHLILFVPNAAMEHFCHLEWNAAKLTVQIYTCSKDKRSSPTERECEHIGSLVTAIGYCMWKCTK